ncbi:hypothetical protein O181_016856 [Austropuccinia psidii MF-1]|uniref:Reverse transcriptase n=1 Tax=Austropuccinia psidii MF-1 TaxID=1389203 RepID=A0A9Q3C6I8_9BASI|nr:hypothetical protein [Austropuccinia psidii MF-1]
MCDAIREQSDDNKDTREEFIVEYQEESPLEIQDIQLEGGMPQDTSNKNFCKHTQDAQTLLVTPTKGMAYIHGTATKMTVCIDNAQHSLIIYSGEHCSIVARNYLDSHFPNWQNQLLPTKAKNFKSASGKMTSIGTIIKQIYIPHWKGNIRIKPGFVVVNDAHIQGFLLGTDDQRMYGIDIYNSKNRHITIGVTKEKEFSLDIYQISAQIPLEELLNEFREGQFSTTLTSKIRGHDIELYLDVERPYPPMLRRPPDPASLETRKDIEKHINELLDMDVIRKIGHNEIVLCGDFRALNNYTKADGYAIPRIPHALEKLAKAKYITKMDFMNGFHQNGVKPNPVKLLRIICHMVIYEYTRMPFGIKNASAHFQRMMDAIFQEEILEVWIVVYIDDISIYSETWEEHVQYIDRVFAHITSSLYKLSSKYVVFEINKERRDAYERIKYELTNAPVLIFPEFELPFKLYIDAGCSQGLGAALHQRQIVDGEPREGVICYISGQLIDPEDRYGATQTEFICLVWALEKLHYYLEGAVFEVYTDCTALKSLLNMKTTNRHMLRWQIAIQEYTGIMIIIHKQVKSHTNADGL